MSRGPEAVSCIGQHDAHCDSSLGQGLAREDGKFRFDSRATARSGSLEGQAFCSLDHEGLRLCQARLELQSQDVRHGEEVGLHTEGCREFAQLGSCCARMSRSESEVTLIIF